MEEEIKKTDNNDVIDNFYKENSGAKEKIELANKFPLKNPINIVPSNSDWLIQNVSAKKVNCSW
jgi:hypothetical protein